MNKKQLWDSLLQQAISGKLVPQLDSEPAVEQIGPAPASDDVPFKLPEKWQWVRMEDIVTVQPKVTVNDDEQLVSFVPMEKVSQGFNNDIDLSLAKPWRDVKNNYSRFADGDVIFAKITPCFQNRKSAIVDNTVNGIGCGSTEFITLRCSNLIFNKYLLWFVKCPYFINLGQSKFRGTAGQQRFAPKDVKSCLVPLPPLEEQRRIVAKLDELKPLVDQFGEAYDKLSELEADFPRKLKASILQAAMQGKLVPQLDTEPAVEQIGPAPAPDEVLFKLPEKWKWVQAKYMGSWKSGATPRRDNAEFWKNGTVPWLKTGEVSNGLVLATEEFVTEKAVKQARLRLNPEGSVLIAMYGTGTVGNIGILGIPCTTNQACCACITDSYVVINWFLFYVLIAFRALLINKAAGTTNLQNLSKDKIEKIWVPLPPLEEQRRIVERIEQLFAEVDKMSACKAP